MLQSSRYRAVTGKKEEAAAIIECVAGYTHQQQPNSLNFAYQMTIFAAYFDG
jgi:hypothetical protein